MLHPARYPIIKPPRGILLNRNHPMSIGMRHAFVFNELTGISNNDYAGKITPYSIDTPASITWDAGRRKFSPDCGFYYDISELPSFDLGAGTILVNGNLLGNYSSFANATPCGYRTAYGSNFFYPYVRMQGYNYNFYIDCGNLSGYDTGVDVGASGDYNFTLGLSFSGLSYRAYINGILVDSGSLSSSPTAHNFCIGGVATDGGAIYEGWDGVLNWTYVWGRQLSDREIRSLERDPYQIFEQSLRSKYFNVSAGTATVPIMMNHYRRLRA